MSVNKVNSFVAPETIISSISSWKLKQLPEHFNLASP